MDAQKFKKALPSLSSEVPAHKVLAHILMLAPQSGRVGKGFDLVGDGWYSEVYRHPSAPGVVFKVTDSREDEGFIKEDGTWERPKLDAYALYVGWVLEYAKRCRHEPIMPKVLMALSDGRKHVYVIEALDTKRYDDPYDTYPLANVLYQGTKAPGFGSLTKRQRGFTLFLREKIESTGISPDLHEGNLMYREVIGADGYPNRVPVMTDPVAGLQRHSETSDRYTKRITSKAPLRPARQYRGSAVAYVSY